MMSPRFHSAAFLVHLSGFGVAIHRACRLFSFLCVSTQLVMLCVSICSSASSVILVPYAIQSSSLSSRLAVLPSSSSNEILLSWSYSSCVLSSSRVSSLIASSRVFSFGWQRTEGCQCMANVTTLGRTQTNCHRAGTTGSRPLEKKGTENNENRFYIVCAPTMRATETCGSRDNTKYFLSGEATSLNTSWMEQNPRQAEYLCRDQHAVVLKLTRNNTLATKALAPTFFSEYFLSGEQPP